MLVSVPFQKKIYHTDLSKGIDISIPLIPGSDSPKCFFAPSFNVEPVKSGDFIGEISAGSPVNFRNIFINPHGNGTHTECVGHITAEPYTINQCLTEFHFIASLITVMPLHTETGDHIITEKILYEKLKDREETPVVIIRTLPNDSGKLRKDYSGTNPPYFTEDAIKYLNKRQMKHLMTDLPSIDREEDGGKLTAHKMFWMWPSIPDIQKTITEMVFIENAVEDGLYLCNIQIISIESDASPSKIIIYPLNII